MRERDRWIVLGASVLTAWGAFVALFFPPFLSWDSYDYMIKGIHPVAGAIHPIGFGLFLRLLAEISVLLWDNAFSHLYQLCNVIALAIIGSSIWGEIRRSPLTFWNHKARRLILGGLILVFLGLVLPAWLFLMNAFWSEMISFLLMVVIARSIDRFVRTTSAGNLLLLITLSTFAYHVRYQFLIIPVVLISLGGICIARSASSQKLTPSIRLGAAAAAISLGVWASSLAIATHFGSEISRAWLGNQFLKVSIQCRLKCDVALFDQDCSTTEGRRLVEQASCKDLLHGLESLGNQKQAHDGMGSILYDLGATKTLHWLAEAPLSLLQEKYHHLEYEMFEFDENIRVLSSDREFIGYYSRLFVATPGLSRGSEAFQRLLRFLEFLYFKTESYPLLTAATALASVVVIMLSRSPMAIVLGLFCVGNFLAFSYFNPQTPLRFLMQIITPGILALLIAAAHPWGWRLIANRPATDIGSDTI